MNKTELNEIMNRHYTYDLEGVKNAFELVAEIIRSEELYLQKDEPYKTVLIEELQTAKRTLNKIFYDVDDELYEPDGNGYHWEGMEKVPYKVAKDYFMEHDEPCGLYLLYPDNTEGECETIEELEEHYSRGGEFGFEK